MKIAVHAADLDHERIDGTRVYLFNVLRNFGKISNENFFIYHQKEFNKLLTPPDFENYFFRKIPFAFRWTQTRFAFQLFLDKPDALWMPVHNIPFFKRKSLKTVVTIHDLAFKIFPEHFISKDLRKLNRLTDMAVQKSDHIIAVSQSTKNDILKFYPEISQEKISVIYHGINQEEYSKKISEKEKQEILSKFELGEKKYLLYIGAIQPRKNLTVLIEAFEKIKKEKSDLKLVFAGAPAWKSEQTFEKIEKSEFKKNIIVTGRIPFEEQIVLYQNAFVSVCPSMYEGFGIPVLESMSAECPVICANNSSLTEVGGEAAIFFETNSSDELAEKIKEVSNNENFRKEMIEKGKKHVENFSWENCAKETLEEIKKIA